MCDDIVGLQERFFPDDLILMDRTSERRVKRKATTSDPVLI